MTNEINTIKRLNKKSSALRIIGLIGILLAFATFVFYTRYQKSEIDSKISVIEKKDSALAKLTDSTISIKSKEDSIKDYISTFLKIRKNPDICKKYFSAVVLNYYGNKNLTVENIIKIKSDLYREYPRVKVDFSKNDISLSYEKDTLIAYIPLKDYMDSLKTDKFYPRTFKLKLTDKGKIFYITAYREEDKIKN